MKLSQFGFKLLIADDKKGWNFHNFTEYLKAKSQVFTKSCKVNRLLNTYEEL